MIRSAMASLLIAVFLMSPSLSAQPPAKVNVLIKVGRLIDVRSGQVLTNQAILVEDERIKEVGPAANIAGHAPAGARVIDLSNATVLPGLIDCHTHLLSNWEGASDSHEPLLTVTQMSAGERALLGAAMAREDLEAGITTVRDLGLSGINGDVALRNAINAGWVEGPRMIVSTRKLTPTGGQTGSLQSLLARDIAEQEFAIVNGPEGARRAVREAVYLGADVIKVVIDAGKRVLSDEEMKAIVDEAHRSKIKVAVHATTDLGIRTAVAAGADSIEHGSDVTDQTLQTMRDKGIFLVPTDFTPDSIRAIFQVSRLSPEERADLEGFLAQYPERSLKRLQRAMRVGVKIAAGSDMVYRYPGKTRGEASMLMLEALRNEGMSPLEVIRAATINAAELLGWEDRVGSIEANKFADLIAVEGDPLKDMTEFQRVTFVMKGGRVIKDRLTKARAPETAK